MVTKVVASLMVSFISSIYCCSTSNSTVEGGCQGLSLMLTRVQVGVGGNKSLFHHSVPVNP